MRSPVKIRKHLVTRAPAYVEPIQYDHDLYSVREITQKDIDEEPWLNKRSKAFTKMLKDGHVGHILLNDNNKCIAYAWIAIGNVRPRHIPKIPDNSVWSHYAHVREEYRGKGLQRVLLYERIKLVRERYGNIEIFADTSENNIPSRINQEKVGFIECGIYYTVEIGSRRIPFLHFLFGKWDKDKKHPEISNNKDYKK